MKKSLKILFGLMIALTILMMIFENPSFASEFDFEADWTKKGDKNITNVAENITGSAISVIRIVGTGISIIMLSYVAIKYMMAAPSEKAEFKKSATAFVVGAIVLFAATNILAVIADFATTNIQLLVE